MRTAAAQMAAEQREAVGDERPGPEPLMRLDELPDPRRRRAVQPGQGDMRLELPPLGSESGTDRRRLDLFVQMTDGVSGVDSDPDHAGLAAALEAADPGQPDRKGGGCDLVEEAVQVLGPVVVDLADEAQGNVQALGPDPARLRQARAQDGQPVADQFRQRDADEESHGPPPEKCVETQRKRVSTPV